MKKSLLISPPLTNPKPPWIGILQNTVDFPLNIFLNVMTELIHHPERTSSVILRTDILKKDFSHLHHLSLPLNFDFSESLTTCYTRRIIPRNPNLDSELDQKCCIFTLPQIPETAIILFEPILLDSNNIPFYHPRVKSIAFTFSKGLFRIDIIPIDDISTRLQRMMLNLGKIISKYGYSRLQGYKKRVHHDIILPKKIFQDTYIRLKLKYANQIISHWVESTNPTKHVFEDLGIAAFIISLWEREKDLPCPKFVDIGCGNGLLVYLLTEEGYQGYGIDIRKRKSWDIWKSLNNNVKLFQEMIHPGKTTFPENSFLIGNHADELTPWIPILATLNNSLHFINIPCCPWRLSGKFSDKKPLSNAYLPEGNSDLSNGRYGAYLAYIADLCQKCGYIVDYEALRIPSTRNWCILGTSSSCGDDMSEKKVALQYLSEWNTDSSNVITSSGH